MSNDKIRIWKAAVVTDCNVLSKQDAENSVNHRFRITEIRTLYQLAKYVSYESTMNEVAFMLLQQSRQEYKKKLSVCCAQQKRRSKNCGKSLHCSLQKVALLTNFRLLNRMKNVKPSFGIT
jgi:hypothetical protein